MVKPMVPTLVSAPMCINEYCQTAETNKQSVMD